MESIRRESFEIKSYNVDFLKCLKPSALMQFFEEAATNHAAELGAGYDVLIARDYFWALCRLNVEIARNPHLGESILIETWPCGSEGLLFRRDFIVYDKDQNIIVRAVSAWLLLKVSTLRPQRPSQLDIDLPFIKEKKSLNHFPERITVNTDHIAFRKTTSYNEIDHNLHVNNTRYLDWATDCFQMNHYQEYVLSEFTLEFLSETLWGDEIELRIGGSKMKTDIEAIGISSGIALFRAVLNWNTRR